MVFYFSGTGNTQWAAEELARTIGETLINISETQNGESKFRPEHNERIGFCFPVHGWRPPVNVRRFIEKLRIEKSERHYCYAICTAGDSRRNYGLSAKRLAEKRSAIRCGLVADNARIICRFAVYGCGYSCKGTGEKGTSCTRFAENHSTYHQP